MTITIPETKPLFDEKTQLLIKLSKSDNYQNEEEKEKDEARVGELEVQIMRIVQDKLKNLKVEVKNKVHKVTDMKDARKLLRKKYEDYRLITIRAREFVDELVEKKKEGRDLLERVVELKGKYDKKVVDDILKF